MQLSIKSWRGEGRLKKKEYKKPLIICVTVYATTAANPKESSYACYYDDERQTYLGDWYSVNWMEDSDLEDLRKETLHKQFQLVKKRTNTSHVMQYGNRSISSMKVMQFQGMGKKAMPISLPPVENYDLTPSPDVPFAIMKRKLMATNDISEAKKIAAEMKVYLEVKKKRKTNCSSGQINFYPKQWHKESP